MPRHSVTLTLSGRRLRTSISLERPFYEELRRIAAEKEKPISDLVNEIAQAGAINLSSDLRLFVLQEVMRERDEARTFP